MNVVMREEKKFLITIEEFRRKSHFLNGLMLQDSHNGLNGYMIRSLYFDTIEDNDFFEKLDGVETRRKIRLRCYEPNSSFAMLEMKQKQGAAQKKRSLRLSREDAEALIDGRYEVLLGYPEEFAKECYGLMHYRCYRPKTIVQYNRMAYIAKENKIRITFDNNLIATESSFDLFSDKLLMNPVMDKFNVVLEVKFNGFLLDYIRGFINSIDKSELSVSKYALARQQSYSEI